MLLAIVLQHNSPQLLNHSQHVYYRHTTANPILSAAALIIFTKILVQHLFGCSSYLGRGTYLKQVHHN